MLGTFPNTSEDIEAADFVALDLEFSGLFQDAGNSGSVRCLSLHEYYTKCVTSIMQFLPLQLGICCAHRRGADSAWELRVHEFNLWPCKRVFLSDFKSLRFLREHGFDFNSFLDNGFRYSRLESQASKKARRQDASQLIRTLHSRAVPLVVHNGLLDLLHLFHGFIGDLPQDFPSFATNWTAHFPRLFDTRLLAQEGQYQIFKHAGGLSLENMHRHLLCSEQTQHLVFDCQGWTKQAHGSSGQDALLTAKVFVMELELWIYSDTMSVRERRREERLRVLEQRLPPGWQEVHEMAKDIHSF